MSYRLFVSKEFEAEFSKLDKAVQRRVVEKLHDIVEAPQSYGKPLRHGLKGLWSARAGGYRIIYTMQGGDIYVVTVRHRKKAY